RGARLPAQHRGRRLAALRGGDEAPDLERPVRDARRSRRGGCRRDAEELRERGFQGRGGALPGEARAAVYRAVVGPSAPHWRCPMSNGKIARKLVPFDPVRYLDDDEAIAEYLTIALESDDPDLLLL